MKTKVIIFVCFSLIISLLQFSGSVRSYDMQKLARWESLYLAHKSLKLTSIIDPIDTHRVECAKDRYSLEEVQQDIDRILLESNLLKPYNGIQTEWRGIPLRGLPVGHVNYFLQGSQSLSEAVDVSSCRLAPCVFNTIYNKSEDALEGHVAFLFFLKSGYMLSGTVDLPNTEVLYGYYFSSLDLSSYYFRDHEFYLAWLWLQSASEKVFNLQQTLQNIYRLPHDYDFNSWCGRAGMGQGWIFLAEECLSNNRRISRRRYEINEWWQEEGIERYIRGQAVGALAHEVGHHYDWNFVYPNGTHSTRLSNQEDFLSLSGWSLEEYHNEQGQLVRSWQHFGGQEGYDDFVRPYSSKNPGEDFADGFSFFRYYPSTFRKVSPRKFQYFKEHVFEGRSYDLEGINTFLNSKISSLIQTEQNQWLSVCLQSENHQAPNFTSLSSDENLRQEFISRGLSEQTFDCFAQSMERSVDALLAEFKFEELEGCYLLSSREKDWWHNLFFQERVSLIALLDDMERSRQISEQTLLFRGAFKRNFDAAQIAIDCYQEQQSGDPSSQSSSESCFTSKLQFYINFTLRDYDLLDETVLRVRGEIERLNEIYSYSKFHREAEIRVRRVMQITAVDLRAKTDEMVNTCSSQAQFVTDENLYFPYRGLDDVTLKSWFLNCLNVNYRQTLTNALRMARGGYRVLDLEFQEFIYGVYNDDFLTALDLSVQDFVYLELGRLMLVEQNVFNNLKNDSSWYLGATANVLGETILESCLRRSRELVAAHTDMMVSESIQSSTNICSKLFMEDPYRRLFNEGLAGLHGYVMEQLWSIILERWNIAKEECHSRKWCLTLKIIPIVMSSWSMFSELNQTVIAQYTKKERQKMTRLLILRLRNLLSI